MDVQPMSIPAFTAWDCIGQYGAARAAEPMILRRAPTSQLPTPFAARPPTRALELLAGCPQEGCTEAIMLAHGKEERERRLKGCHQS
jgi:hypothetical protein